MEFMDRRHRSLLVQFWLTVESFKNPLESVNSDSEDDVDETIQDPATSATTVKEDISMITDLYFSGSSPHPLLASIPSKYVDAIRDFAANDAPSSPTTQRRVRRSVMLAQRQVERDMEQDFDDFERSDLWFRAIGDTDFGKSADLSQKERPFSGHHSAQTSPPSTPKYGRGNPPQMHHFDSSPAFTMHRTISSTSARSTQSVSGDGPRILPSNIEVLMSPVSEVSSNSSRAPLFDDPDDELQRAEEQRMQAIQAALTDIMALEQDNNDKPPIAEDHREQDSNHRMPRSNSDFKRRPVFDEDVDDDIDGDEDNSGEAGESQKAFQIPNPGDLQLSYEITRLGGNISNLQVQEAMLETLIKKAELTGDTQELRLLAKSKSSMDREIRELKFQKLQYEQQESANRLFSDRTKVSIVSSTVADEEGKSVVRYLVEVQQLAPDGSFASGWVVARRYNEFLNMHNKLRDKYGLVRNLDFPGKRLVTALSGNLVDTRKVALEKYLQVSLKSQIPISMLTSCRA